MPSENQNFANRTSIQSQISICFMELLSFQSVFTFLLFLFMLVKIGKRSKTQYQKLPPGPWKLPIIGSTHHLKGLPHHSLATLAKKYGPLMHLQVGEVLTIVISSPEVAKEVMKTHDLKFANRSVSFIARILTYDGKDMGFAPYGDYWRQMRKISMTELLSAKRVHSFQKLREEEVSNLIQSISSTGGSMINLSEKIYASTNDVTAKAAFGKKFEDKEAFKSLVQEAIQLGAGFTVADLFPSLKFLHVISGMKAKVELIHQKLDRIFEDIIKEHKEKRRTSKLNNDENEEDLVDVLLRLQADPELEFPITNENIKGVMVDVFMAGPDTSATVIEWTMSDMLRNPTVMEKAQAEVRQILNGKTDVKETDINELSYLKLVIKESLRLHPPGPLLLPRECRERCEIGGYEIPAKTKVIINAWAMGRDPEYWTDPEKFDPERFNGTSFDFKGSNVEYIPFGAGRRICPGILFGMANVEIMLAKLLYHFDWKLPKGVKPEELDMTEAFGSTVRRRDELCLSAIPYSP